MACRDSNAVVERLNVEETDKTGGWAKFHKFASPYVTPGMALWKSVGTIYLLAWIVHGLAFWTVKRHATGYFRAHVLHLEFVLRLQLLMILGSVFIWKRLTMLFLGTVGPKQKDIEEDNNDARGRRSYRLVSTPAASTKLKHFRLVMCVIVVLFLVSAHISQFVNYFANSVEPRVISMVSLTSFGIWIHLVAFLVGFGILNFLVRFIHSKSLGQATMTPIFSRYPFIKQLLTNGNWQTIMATLLSVVICVFLLFSAGNPRIKRIDVELKKLPKSMDGLTIALLTDMHAGPTVGRKAFSRVVEMTNEQKPDIVAIVGDLVDGAIDKLKPVVEPIGQLKAKYGVYFSTGNHEMYYGRVDEWIAYLETLNVKVLRNENVEIRPTTSDQPEGKQNDKADGPYLCLAGADDITAAKTGIDGHRMDLRAAVNGCSLHSPVVLLAHNPKAAKEALELERQVDLILCGHTHAGQIYILVPYMYMRMPFFYGLYEYAGSLIYVSSGVFYMGAPMKMFYMSEITLITLKSGSIAQ